MHATVISINLSGQVHWMRQDSHSLVNKIYFTVSVNDVVCPCQSVTRSDTTSSSFEKQQEQGPELHLHKNGREIHRYWSQSIGWDVSG
jgi:hypothetical protein